VKVINFFGGPGAGKSTAAAGLFYEMKKRWMRVELVSEFAKELVWSGSSHLLSHQNYVFAEQEHRLNRLIGQVDIAVTDSPLLLSAFYAPEHYAQSFKHSVFDFFDTYENINILVRRSHEYSGAGRLQNMVEADSIANGMEDFLMSNGVPYYLITASDASPRYLLHWLVNSGLVDLREDIAEISEADRPPEGWLRPVLHQNEDAGGNLMPRTDASMSRNYIEPWIRKS
jgi:hypothetical protein